MSTDTKVTETAEDSAPESRHSPHIYQAIANITGRLASAGIGKDKKNVTQGYMFRGIDDIYNAIARHLADEGVCILPHVLSRDVTERATQKGGVLFYVVVKVEFAFVAAKDGSAHRVTMYGEAMDSGDKATNKAMSAAYKYACLEVFCIPTEGDNDADATTHQVAALERITDKQVADLHALIEEVGLSPELQEKLLRVCKIKSLSEIVPAAYSDVVKMIESKRRSGPQ